MPDREALHHDAGERQGARPQGANQRPPGKQKNALRRPQKGCGEWALTSAGVENCCSVDKAVTPAQAGVTARIAVANRFATSRARACQRQDRPASPAWLGRDSLLRPPRRRLKMEIAQQGFEFR